MKRVTIITVLGVLFSLFSCSAVFAGGYEIYEHGAVAVGMAGAWTASAKGAFAVFYNPAGIVGSEGLELGLGTALIKPSGSYTTATGTVTDQESQLYYPSHFYVTYPVHEKITAGFGFFTPFGLGTEWPAEWRGRYRAIKTDLKTFYLNPVVAFELTPNMSLGVGFDYILSSVELTQKIPVVHPIYGYLGDAGFEMTGDGSAASFNFGFLAKAGDKASFAVTYRHSADIEYDGDATYTVPNPAVKPLFVDSSGSAEIHMPKFLTIGVAFKPAEKFTLETDIDWYGWSGAKEIPLHIDKAPGNPSVPYNTAMPQDYDDSWLWRIGTEYKLSEAVALRGGYIYDPSPVPDETLDPTLPDANRHDVALGVGFTKGKATFDFAYLLVMFGDRKSENLHMPELLGGTYSTTAHLFNLSFGYKF
ncbi:MAG: outer membrane protein transport protein [Acidobacteriota bacterium]